MQGKTLKWQSPAETGLGGVTLQSPGAALGAGGDQGRAHVGGFRAGMEGAGCAATRPQLLRTGITACCTTGFCAAPCAVRACCHQCQTLVEIQREIN